MVESVIDLSLCTGCGACEHICPIKCITMEYNSEGFLYPVKGSSCIDCGLCVKRCPRMNESPQTKNHEQRAYAAVSKSKITWKKSASGGAFVEICRVWKNDKTIFVGAAWEGFKVVHKIVDFNNIHRLSKSKYLFSEMGQIFPKVKKYLNEGYRVVFSGTPCQVAGLKAYLKVEYENLLLIDIICHGVGSPKVFEDCIKQTEIDLNCTIDSFEFRYKGNVFAQDHIEKIKSNKNEILIQDDRYLQLFIQQHCIRKSCGENCIYRTKKRQGDITIGDFKGLMEVFPDLLGGKKNYSVIVANNSKAERIIKSLENYMNIRECSINDVEKYNPIFAHHTYFSKERDNFFSEYINKPMDTIRKWTTPGKIYHRGIKCLYDALPIMIRKKICELSIRKR